jgi:thioredoxin-like negative regulator of GroEL
MPRRPKGQADRSRKTSATEREESVALTRRWWFTRTPWLLTSLGTTVLLLVIAILGWLTSDSSAWLRSQAEAASRAGDSATALRYWRAINATSSATATTHLAEARTCLTLGRAAQAEVSLRRAINADPSNAEPCRLLLQILRVEDRVFEAQSIGWSAYGQIKADQRRVLLRELTLGLLVDLPDNLVRSTLKRWVASDSDDLDAQIALLQRLAAQPRAADPDRPTILSVLESHLKSRPDHIGARAVLITALADAGEPDQGRAILDQWPEAQRDARYWRLRGRWELEYDHHPDLAIAAFRTALAELPQDWQSWYRLARAFRISKQFDESRRAAETVGRIREVLDPLTLEPRLDAAFDHLDDITSLRNLAALCQQAGLTQLASAWLAEIGRTTERPFYTLLDNLASILSIGA